MAEKDVVIYYRAGVEDFDYDTGFVLATDYEALRKRCEAVEADAARLDWLERTCVNAADEYGTGSQLYFGTYATAPLRDAIDQAIAAAQEPSHG